MADNITIKLVHSAIGRNVKQKRTIEALGLRKLNQTKSVPDNPAMRGMLFKVKHLVKILD